MATVAWTALTPALRTKTKLKKAFVVVVCPMDSDEDGTADCRDLCPEDADKLVPGVCGCGVADADSDGDDQLDCQEACPEDPRKTEPGECGCGVVDADSDGDGTLDCVTGVPMTARRPNPVYVAVASKKPM